MAATLNINWVCGKLLNIDSILQEFKDSGIEVWIEKKSCIDTWMWDHQQKFQTASEMERSLDKGKIAVFHLGAHRWKDFGMYVEKTEGKYVYDLWINTEGYPELDADMITAGNQKHFQQIYQIILQMFKKQSAMFEVLAIGVEIIFRYRKNILDTMKESEHVITWMIDQSLEKDIVLTGYHKKVIDNFDIVVFERQ